MDDTMRRRTMVHHAMMDYPMRRHVVYHPVRRIRLSKGSRSGEGRGDGKTGKRYKTFHRNPPLGNQKLDCIGDPEWPGLRKNLRRRLVHRRGFRYNCRP
jgi:hypothetical protein